MTNDKRAVNRQRCTLSEDGRREVARGKRLSADHCNNEKMDSVRCFQKGRTITGRGKTLRANYGEMLERQAKDERRDCDRHLPKHNMSFVNCRCKGVAEAVTGNEGADRQTRSKVQGKLRIWKECERRSLPRQPHWRRMCKDTLQNTQ